MARISQKRIRRLSLPIILWNTNKELPTVTRTNYRDRSAVISVVVQDVDETDRRTILEMTPDQAAKLVECLTQYINAN